MKKIWKYTLEILDEQVISMPRNANILYVENQYGDVKIWVEVDDEEEVYEDRTIYMHGTGHTYEAHNRYIGSVQIYNGNLVFHIFE